MGYMVAAYTIASVTIFGYVLLHGVRRKKSITKSNTLSN